MEKSEVPCSKMQTRVFLLILSRGLNETELKQNASNGVFFMRRII